MKLDKKKEFQGLIIRRLLTVSNTSLAKLATSVGLSEKTTRTYTNELNDALKAQRLGEIQKKRGVGVCLVADTGQRKELATIYALAGEQLSPDQFEVRELTRRLLLLDDNHYVTKTKLAEAVYESVPTLSRSLDKLKVWFERFDLSIQAQPSKGITLVGNEFSRRQAIKSFIVSQGTDSFDHLMKVFAPNINVTQVSATIKDAEHKWRIQFTDRSFNVICVMVSLCLARARRPIIDMDQILNRTEFYNEYNFSDTIFQLLRAQGIDHRDNNDVRLIALEIITANKIKWNHSPNVNSAGILQQTAFDEALKTFVAKLIQSISEILGTDLTVDSQLYEGLVQHLRSAIFRMKYGQSTRNLSDSEIKNKYKEVYLSVLATSPLFEKYYNVQITETELNYIVLYIEAALLRKQQQVEVVLVTDLGRAQRLLAVEMIKHYVPQISAVNIFSQKTYLEAPEKQTKSFVLTTERLPENEAAITIHNLPDSQDLDRIKNKINEIKLPDQHDRIFSKDSQSFFDVNLIDVRVPVDSKKALLKRMADKMVLSGKVKPQFFDSVWSREKATTTSIGNQVALPHGDMDLVNEPCVFIATLAKPVIWFDGEAERVQTVIVLATKMNNRFEVNRTKHFFQDLIAFTEDSRRQEQLLQMTDKSQVYNFLFS